MLKIVAVGGGTGLPVVLRGLKEIGATDKSMLSISAIVCMSDNGGSSGLLRQSFGIPAVGDLRNCLIALAAHRTILSDLFEYRFCSGDGLQGHSLGNLIVTALCQKTGTLCGTVRLAAQILQLEGEVLPVTESSTTLCAEFSDGSVVRGESQIRQARREITRAWLEPKEPPASTGVVEAIVQADAVVLGPGSLYTSIIPNLLVSGVADAIRKSQALKVFVVNLMTEPGETANLSASAHLKVLEDYLGPQCIDVCVLNCGAAEPRITKEYVAQGAEPVRMDPEAIASMGPLPVSADLVMNDGMIRHVPEKLANLVVSLTRGALRARAVNPRFAQAA